HCLIIRPVYITRKGTAMYPEGIIVPRCPIAITPLPISARTTNNGRLIMKKCYQGQRAGTDRRNFLKMMGRGGISRGGTSGARAEAVLAETTKNVNRLSGPSDLKITDMRIAEITGVVFRTPIIRIYTNQGIVGHGDVRDGAAKEYALILKSRLLGENP